MRASPLVTGRLKTLIPLSSVADLSQIERVRSLLEGQSVVIVGSAPLSTPRAPLAADEIAVPVNGGISSTDGIVPLWIVGSKKQDLPNSPYQRPLHAEMLAQATGRSVDHVLMLRGPKIATEQATLAALERLRCLYRSWSVLDKPTKRWLEGELCARKNDAAPCSSGILAAAIACYCRPARVRLVGFSFEAGYHYLKHQQPQKWWRDHIDADHRALKALLERGYPLEGDILRKIAA